MSHDLRFSPSGETLAVVYVDGQLVLWDVQTGALKRERTRHGRTELSRS